MRPGDVELLEERIRQPDPRDRLRRRAAALRSGSAIPGRVRGNRSSDLVADPRPRRGSPRHARGCRGRRGRRGSRRNVGFEATGDLADLAGEGPADNGELRATRSPALRWRLPLQPLVDHESAAMGRAGDLVRVIGRQAEEAGVRRPGFGDLVVAARSLHEDHPTSGRQARRHPVERLGDRRHGPGDHPGHLPREVRADLVRVDLDLLESRAPGRPRGGSPPAPRAARPGSSAPAAARSSTGCPATPAPIPCRSAATATPRTGAPAGYRHSASAPCSRSCGSASGSAARSPRAAADDSARASRAGHDPARPRNASRSRRAIRVRVSTLTSSP